MQDRSTRSVRGSIPGATKVAIVSVFTGLAFDELGLEPGTRYVYWAKASSPAGSAELSSSFKTRRR